MLWPSHLPRQRMRKRSENNRNWQVNLPTSFYTLCDAIMWLSESQKSNPTNPSFSNSFIYCESLINIYILVCETVAVILPWFRFRYFDRSLFRCTYRFDYFYNFECENEMDNRRNNRVAGWQTDLDLNKFKRLYWKEVAIFSSPPPSLHNQSN